MAAGPRRAEHGAAQPPGSWELQEVSAQMCPRAWLLAASVVTASPSQCSSGDKDGKGFVSPSLVTGWAHIGRQAIKPMQPSVPHAGRGDAGVPSPPLH